jgi:hypothetical protein
VLSRATIYGALVLGLGCAATDGATPGGARKPPAAMQREFTLTSGKPASSSSALPAAVAPPPVPPPSRAPPEPGHADLDPENDGVVAPPASIPDCADRLTRAGIAFGAAELPVRKRGGVECGAHEAVVYRGPKDGVRWSSAPIVSCGMALALGRFETVLREVAEVELGSRVVRIEQGGTYNCRNMARFDMVSEHSYANAIDVRSFRLADGRTVSVERHFGRPGTEPRTSEARFLHVLAHRLYDDGVFSVVLTEYFDRLHRDHFHFDLARYRIDGTR